MYVPPTMWNYVRVPQETYSVQWTWYVLLCFTLQILTTYFYRTFVTPYQMSCLQTRIDNGVSRCHGILLWINDSLVLRFWTSRNFLYLIGKSRLVPSTEERRPLPNLLLTGEYWVSLDIVLLMFRSIYHKTCTRSLDQDSNPKQAGCSRTSGFNNQSRVRVISIPIERMSTKGDYSDVR